MSARQTPLPPQHLHTDSEAEPVWRWNMHMLAIWVRNQHASFRAIPLAVPLLPRRNAQRHSERWKVSKQMRWLPLVQPGDYAWLTAPPREPRGPKGLDDNARCRPSGGLAGGTAGAWAYGTQRLAARFSHRYPPATLTTNLGDSPWAPEPSPPLQQRALPSQHQLPLPPSRQTSAPARRPAR